MTRDRDIERVLDRWFEEGPTEVADRVISGALDLVDRTHQRHTQRAPRRYRTMPGLVRLAAAAVVVALLGGAALLALRPGIAPPVGGAVTPAPTATALNAPSGAVAVTTGAAHSCLLTQAGVVKCWGAKLANSTRTDSTHPVDVAGLTSGVRAISAGYAHTCALTAADAVKCWGNNYYGQLGDGTLSDGSLMPVAVVGLTADVRAIASGDGWTCAVMNRGNVKCWGANSFGQLGDGSLTNSDRPVDVVGLTDAVGISAGGVHTCVITREGAVKCWGANWSGQFGDGTRTDDASPVTLSGLRGTASAIALGGSHTCAAVGPDGVKCWGANSVGQLGNGGTTDSLTPAAVLGLNGQVIALAASATSPSYELGAGGPVAGDQTCAVTAAGAATCWGQNNRGQLGDGSTTDRSRPTSVTGLASDVVAVSMSPGHACAALSSGGVECWGSNASGQLGNGTTIDSLIPVAVTGL
jgi:alpha-tubulin suppressor-like RCC1 family protein